MDSTILRGTLGRLCDLRERFFLENAHLEKVKETPVTDPAAAATDDPVPVPVPARGAGPAAAAAAGDAAERGEREMTYSPPHTPNSSVDTNQN